MTPDEKRAYAFGFPVHVGVDTGKTFHVGVARGPDGMRTKPFKVPVSRSGFSAAQTHLRQLFPAIPTDRILVGLEFAGHHGFTYAHFLAQAGHHVVNVLPAHTKRTKEIEDNSPLKSDAKDAALICKLVGDGTFVRFPFLKTPYLELRLLTVQRNRLTVEATRYKNRLQGLLDLAWPEFLDHFSNLRKATPVAILERWNLPADVLGSSLPNVYQHIYRASRGHISREKVKILLDSARSTIGLPQAVEERRSEIANILSRWRLLRKQIKDVDDRIASWVDQCPEAKALMSVPEVSAVCAATIVSELGSPQDFQHPRQVLKLAGMNLVAHSSGQMEERKTRKWQSKRGRPALRRQLYLLAGRWCQTRGLYREDYLALRSRNGNLGTNAVAAMARKLVPLLLKVMQTGEPFHLARWQASRRNSTQKR